MRRLTVGGQRDLPDAFAAQHSPPVFHKLISLAGLPFNVCSNRVRALCRRLDGQLAGQKPGLYHELTNDSVAIPRNRTMVCHPESIASRTAQDTNLNRR